MTISSLTSAYPWPENLAQRFLSTITFLFRSVLSQTARSSPVIALSPSCLTQHHYKQVNNYRLSPSSLVLKALPGSPGSCFAPQCCSMHGWNKQQSRLPLRSVFCARLGIPARSPLVPCAQLGFCKGAWVC